MIRQNHRPILGLKSRAMGGLAALLSSGATAAYALPSFNAVAGTNGTGPGAVYSTSGSTGTVDQTNSRVVINWNSFNIDAGESVNFNQPGKGSIAFNVVPAGQLTKINGSLTATGGIWLFSPAGILIGSGASVSVGSFVASTGIFDTTAGSAQMNQALNTNSVQITAQSTPGQGYVEVDGAVPSNGSMTGAPAGTINADAGFVILHSPTITQDGSVTASDAVVYNANEDLQATFVPSASGITLTSETSNSGVKSASHIVQGADGQTNAGTWFEADAAEDATTEPGYGGVINLSGVVNATGMKADTANPSDPGNGYSVILNGDDGGISQGSEVTTIDASGSTVNASNGIYANGGFVSVGNWLSTGGGVTISAGGPGGVLIDPPLVSTGPGLVSITGQNVEIDSDVTAAGSISILSYDTTVGPGVAIQAGKTITGSSLIAKSTGDIDIDPSSSLFVGPALDVPTGALTLSAGATVTPQDNPSVGQVHLGTGGDLTVGYAEGTSVTLQAAPLGDVGGTLDIEGSVDASGSVLMRAAQLILGGNGGIGAGSASEVGSGVIAVGSATSNIVLQNVAMPAAVPAGAGDILLGAPVSIPTPGANVYLTAYNSIVVSGAINVSGSGSQVNLTTSFNPCDCGGDYSFINGGSLSFTAGDNSQSLFINGSQYTLVYSLSDLLNINSDLGGNYALAGPLDLAGGTTVTAGDTATVFTAAPIASTVYAPFTGTFTGLGNTISNLNIQAAPPVGQQTASGFVTDGPLGLFGVVSGGTVRDVNLSNVSITGGNGMMAGALVGDLEFGTVMNASSSGQVNVGDDDPNTSTGEYTGSSATPMAGGLIGLDANSQVVNARSSAAVLGGEPANVGGLAGLVVGGSVADSSASGAVTGGYGSNVGGLAGEVESTTISDSSATGSTTGGQYAGVGGLAGEVGYATITGSFATGAVSGDAGSNIGGFAGRVNNTSIGASYASGDVTQTAAGFDGYPDIAGGFVGSLTDQSSITQSYSSGAVQTVGGPDSGAFTLAGGFAGKIDDSSVSDAYSLGAVTSTTTANADLGGFAGVAQDSSEVDQVYATGLVTGFAGSTTAGLVAALGTSNESAPVTSLTNSYWDTGTTGQSVGYIITPAAAMGDGVATAGPTDKGITGAGVYSAATYANFDFTHTWVLIPGVTRPMLQSEYSTTITNAHQLQLMELDPTATYTLANDIDASGTSAAAGTAGGLWNPATGFSPIGGNGEAAFTGTFDGQGHTVSGLTVAFTTADTQTLFSSLTTNGVVGLFGFVGPAGVLENVNLANAKITAGDGMIAGALAGASLGSVNNASSSGVVTVGNEINTGITADAGGLVGATAGSIANSYSSAVVAGGDAFVGGLLGAGGDGAIIVNSYATGQVSVTAYPSGGVDTPAAGGLVGEFSGSNGGAASAIAGGYASGAVSGGAGSSVGGFIGSLGDATVSDAYATGAVGQTSGGVNGSNSAAGGFVGSMEDGAQINNAYASGDVSSQAAAAGQFTRAGGFAGQIEGDGTGVYDAYALGAVDIKGAGAGTSPAGGFAGAIDNNGEADHVYATGSVSGPGAVAGLVGQVGSTDGTDQTGGSLFDSYWDEGTTGQTVGANAGSTIASIDTPSVIGIGGDTGLSPYDQSTYANFNFAPGTDWYIVPGSTRPILQSEYSTDITNAHQLQLMDMNLNTDYTLGADIDATNVDGASGLWNPATGFSPIGATADSAFGGQLGGQLDGQGHTITNLTVIDTTTVHQTGSSGQASDGAAGLFGFIGPSGMVENIHLTNVNISGGDGMEVGALAGDVAGQIINATSSGSVTVLDGDEEFSADARAGGLVGDLTGTIQNSSSSVTVSGGQASVGGLVGELEAGTITNAFATGAVSVGADANGETPMVGGLVGSTLAEGDSQPSITGSYATGDVTAGGGSVAGGFVGSAQGSITTSYSTGSVTQAASPNGTQNAAGGFAGEVSGGSVTQSFSTGDVNVTGSSTTAQAGGFVGEMDNNGTITDAYATGDVTITGSISDDAGGFAGAILDGGGAITNVYATGQVTANGDVGGLVGYLDGSISDGYWNEGTAHPVTAAVGFTDTDGSTGGVVEGVGGATGNDPFSQYTYEGFDFSLADYGQGGGVWTIPTDGEGIYPQLYGVSHVVTFTATPLNNDPIVYGNYPVYTVVASGLQGGDTYESAVQALQVQPIDPNLDGPPAVGYSGYYNVNLNDAYDLNDPYILSIGSNAAASGPAGAYRTVFNDNNTNYDGTLTITPAQLTLVATSDTMTYDGQTEDTGQNSTPSSTGLVPGDYYTATQSYDDANAGSRTLTVDEGSAQVYDNNNGANYNVSYDETQVAGSITAESIVISATSDNRPYDGGTDSSQTPTVSGTLYNGDSIACLSQAYASKNVMGTDGSTLEVTGYTANVEDSADYDITTASTSGTITPAPLTITAASASRQYDGDTDSTGTPTYDPDQLFGNDSITPSSLTQSFASKDVLGEGLSTLVVNPTYVINDGNGGANYQVTLDTATGTITPAPLTLDATSGTKVYDGGTSSTATPTADGLFPVDSLTGTETYGSKDVLGVGQSTLSISSYTINDGNGGADYTVTQINTASGTITPLALTAGLTGTVQKQYDGDTDATLTSSNYSLPGVIGEDDVTLNDPTSGTYDNRNAGTGKTVTVTGLQLGGEDQEDYSLSSTTVSGPVGIITQAPLTLTAVTETKTYDGTVVADVTPTNSALIEGDSISDVTEAFGSKNVMGANGSTLSVTGYTIDDGNGGNNYAVTLVTAPGTINAAPLTLAAVTDTKTYDGTTASSAVPTESGLVGGDSITGLAEAYDSKDAGARTLSVDAYTINDGNGGANYIVTTTVAPGTIDQKTLSATLVGSVSKPYDGNTDATLATDNYSLTGVVSGDQVSLNDPTSGTYDTPGAGTQKLVSVDGLVLSGADAANYIVNATAAADIGTITAPAQPIVYVIPPADLTQIDLNEIAAAASSVVNFTTTVVNVFPVGNVNNNSNFGDNTPITGSGNRDLWTGWDDTDNPCPPGSSPNCHAGNGGHP